MRGRKESIKVVSAREENSSDLLSAMFTTVYTVTNKVILVTELNNSDQSQENVGLG